MTGLDRSSGSHTVPVIPHWQGPAARFPQRLAEGAHRLSALLPAARRTVAEIAPAPDGIRTAYGTSMR